jgi:hypothetical protein
MLKALIVGQHSGTNEMLQRRVGGILKDIAQVGTCWFEDLDNTNADIYISYSHGVRFPKIKEKLKNRDKMVIAAELTILPVGIRLLKSLEKGCRIGIVAEHLCCANYFLGDILKAGILNFVFIAGTIYEIKQMGVDIVAIPEELVELVNKNDIKGHKILVIPRTITLMCAAEMINAAIRN